MAEPQLDPTARHVREFDPALFKTALFAPEPGRGRLMALYAFDIELSRALSRTAEPMISLMRLQWWRDCLAGIRAGEPARAHEVAGPFHQLLTTQRLSDDLLEALIEAREMEVEGILSRERFDRWADLRFGCLTRLAAGCLVEGGEALVARPAGAAGRAQAVAFALRTAVPMTAAGGRTLLPDLSDTARAGLARGGAEAVVKNEAAALADDGLTELAAARRHRSEVPVAARPAFLPLGEAEGVLRKVRAGADLAEVSAVPRGGAVPMLWRSLTGRW